MKVFAIVSAIMAASASVAFAAPAAEPITAATDKRETNFGGLPLAGMIPGGANNPLVNVVQQALAAGFAAGDIVLNAGPSLLTDPSKAADLITNMMKQATGTVGNVVTGSA
ncbi:hypothetical protein JDV02_002263 [Purpureocillium takamizusanense]|uniref:Uncharacterized protein n=1 Tax=Purpureocillium takamizusanense TaxID=2060973 RepID=A0A9Q8QBE2_9HYPO|nr:uncharacterized protein JDV02_002263 [Purpureocillium takamizusanense]UNI15757.1 hypothetical protein JDV02_002263 [Purpureocillium takamizusanense]